MKEAERIALMAASIMGGQIARTGQIQSVNMAAMVANAVKLARSIDDEVRRGVPAPVTPAPKPAPRGAAGIAGGGL